MTSSSSASLGISSKTHLASVTAEYLHENQIVDGVLSIVQISNDITIVEFESHDFSVSLSLDMEDATLEKENFIIKFVSVLDPTPIQFRLLDNIDLDIFERTQLLCNEVRESTLKIRSIARDFYFSGIYRNLKNSENIQNIVFTDVLKDISSDFNDENLLSALPSTKLDSHLDDNLKTFHRPQRIFCIFCDADNFNSPNLSLAAHPYVSQNFRGETIHLCKVCLGNWGSYRFRILLAYTII